MEKENMKIAEYEMKIESLEYQIENLKLQLRLADCTIETIKMLKGYGRSVTQ